MNLINTFNPEILLGDRLEITLYAMFVEAYLENRLGVESNWYCKFISAFFKEEKEHHPEKFISLIDDIKRHGFKCRFPVFANPEEFGLLNGSHRCAIAICLKQKEVPYVLRYMDDRADDKKILECLGEDIFKILLAKRREYIARCEPMIAINANIRMVMRDAGASFNAPFSSFTRIPSLRCYQSHDCLGIKGKRPSHIRGKIYEVDSFLDRDMRVLEIGCNVGFFSLVLAEFAGQVDAFDVDEHYITIANLAKNFLGIDNCKFIKSSVSNFICDRKYDCVFSTAIHGWVGLNFGKYIIKISDWVKPGGLLFIESHELDAESDWDKKKIFLRKYFEIVKEGIIDDVDIRMYQSEFREFILLRKKINVNYSDICFDDEAKLAKRYYLTRLWYSDIVNCFKSIYVSMSDTFLCISRLIKLCIPPWCKKIYRRYKK